METINTYGSFFFAALVRGQKTARPYGKQYWQGFGICKFFLKSLAPRTRASGVPTTICRPGACLTMKLDQIRRPVCACPSADAIGISLRHARQVFQSRARKVAIISSTLVGLALARCSRPIPDTPVWLARATLVGVLPSVLRSVQLRSLLEPLGCTLYIKQPNQPDLCCATVSNPFELECRLFAGFRQSHR